MPLNISKLIEENGAEFLLALGRAAGAEEKIEANTLGRGFGEGPVEAEWVTEMYVRIGFQEDGSWRHYVGYLDNQPVGTSSLFLGAGAAGIYFVMTIPEARRKGIGAALTFEALREAKGLGYEMGVLGASEMGYPMYRQLGFDEHCRIGIYEWVRSSREDNGG